MKIFDDERVGLWEFSNRVQKHFDLWKEDIEEIELFLHDYEIYEKTPKPKTTFLGRLSSPFLWLFIILLNLLIAPVQWLFTGKTGCKRSSKLGRFIQRWAERSITKI